MAGPSPIGVTHRLALRYRQAGFDHKVQIWLDAVASVDATGYSFISRASYSNVPMSTAVDRFWTVFGGWIDPSSTGGIGAATLYQLAGVPTPLPVATYIPTITPTGSGVSPAWGEVVAIRDSAYNKMNFELLEGGFGGNRKIVSFSLLSPGDQAWVTALTGVGGSPAISDPYVYRQSRAGQYSKYWQSVVVDTNEKLRRKRGLK